MLGDIASACIGIAVALALAFPAGRVLRRRPAAFYAVAVLLVALHTAYRANGAYVAWAQPLLDVLNKAYLSSALLAIVMFTGVLDEQSAARKRLQPVRGELSILSFIFVCDHMIGYAPSFIPVLGRLFNVRVGMGVSFVAAMVLAAVFAVLAVTSLRFVRGHMNQATWKSVQRASYAMVALLWVHVLLVLGRTAFAGTGAVSAQVALGVYTVVTLAYAVLRVRKAAADRRRTSLAE